MALPTPEALKSPNRIPVGAKRRWTVVFVFELKRNGIKTGVLPKLSRTHHGLF